MGVGSASASSAGFGSFQPTLPVDRRDSLGSLSLWAARGTEEQTGPRADWEGTMQASGAIRWRPSLVRRGNALLSGSPRGQAGADERTWTAAGKH